MNGNLIVDLLRKFHWSIESDPGVHTLVFQLRSVIGPKKKKRNPRYSLNQSDTQLKPTTTCSPTFSRALYS